MLIRLETSDCQFVAKFEIPPFKTAPTVCGWGDRVFVQAGASANLADIVKNGGKNSAGYTDYVYRECFAYAIVQKPIRETKNEDDGA